MKRRDAETPREDKVTDKIIGAAIEIHRVLGPGLLESAYEECLCYELSQRQLPFRRQVALPVTYKGVKLACGYKMDLLVDDVVIVEFKTVETLLPVHSAQLLSYLRLAGKPVGLLINFNAAVLKSGLKRIVNQFSEDSASRRLGVEKPGLEDVTALS
jgi:GxxExxY protein